MENVLDSHLFQVLDKYPIIVIPAVSTTTAGSGPVPVSIAMECEELGTRPDSYSCSMRGDVQRFQDGYFNMVTQFDRGDQGVPTAISGVASAKPAPVVK